MFFLWRRIFENHKYLIIIGITIYIFLKYITKVVYYTACIVLKAFEDTINSFAVVMETKSDIYVFDGKAQTCSSSVERGFEVHLPENCLPRNTKVVLKVRNFCFVFDLKVTKMKQGYVKTFKNM